MKLRDEQLVLDTNILVHWLRGKDLGEHLRTTYALGDRRPRPILPQVVTGEIKSLALQLAWGTNRLAKLEALLRDLPVAPIGAEAVIDAYAQLDHKSRGRGARMGKNDLWIAAIAFVQRAVIVTTDKDFNHLHPQDVKVEYVDPAPWTTSAPPVTP